jgi:hypothetical protein
MRVVCRTCKSEIPASDIDIKTKIAKCDSCNNIFDCSDQLLSAVSVLPRETIGMPAGIELLYVENGMQIVRRWFSPRLIFLTLFCLFWDGFMVVWFSIAISQGQWAMAAFGSIHGMIGVGLTYFVIAGYINKTYITVAYESLTVQHKPLPFSGGKTIKSSDLKQLYSKELIHHGRGKTSYSYEVQAITHSDTTVKLLSGLETSEQALFIEHEIEKYLGISDQLVRGEIPRM